MSNNTRYVKYKVPANMQIEVYEENKRIMAVVGAFVDSYKALNGLSDRKLALLAGCSDMAINKLRHGMMDYCGITFLSKVSRACGASLLDVLRGSVNSDGVFGKAA